MQTDYKLHGLADPKEFTNPIVISHGNTDLLLKEYSLMYEIRRAEEVIADNIINGKIKCPCHLAIGQEAIPVGISRHLRTTDRSFGTHRSHGHYLATGGTVYKLFAEILGRSTGCSGGFGGSMHLFGQEHGFVGSVPIVGATIPMAVGAGLAARLDKKSDMDIGICYFGDGAAEEGCLHESLNFAAVFKVPVLFVCENNLFSSHLHINLRQPTDKVARYAQAHMVATEVVDGNDVEAVSKAAQRLIERSRNGEGPGFLEVITYRWRGHVGPSEDNDVGLKRGEELKVWKKRDPLGRLAQAMIEKNMATEEVFKTIRQRVDDQVASAWTKAEKDPFPEHKELLSAVYKESK